MKDAEFLLHWTDNSWGMKIRKTHLCFTQRDSPLWGFQPVSSLLINFFSPLCSLSLSAACTLYNEHTHTPTQPVRNHKTCCFLSCSDDNLPVTRGKRFSQPIKKINYTQCGKVSSESIWGFRQKYENQKQRQLETGVRQTPTLILFCYTGDWVAQRVELSAHSEKNLALVHTYFCLCLSLLTMVPHPVVFRPKASKIIWTLNCPYGGDTGSMLRVQKSTGL